MANFDLPTFKISGCEVTNDECKYITNDEKVNNESVDTFKPPELLIMDSGDEYETELEDNSPGSLSYDICRKSTVVNRLL